jgi:hypothetical protein
LVLILADDFLDDKALRNTVASYFVCDGIYITQMRKKLLRQEKPAILYGTVFF